MLVLWLGIHSSLPARLIQPYPLLNHTYFLSNFSGPVRPKVPLEFRELFNRLGDLMKWKFHLVGGHWPKLTPKEKELNTIYASFRDPELAEKAAGALLDFGMDANDISLLHHQAVGARRVGSTYGVDDYVEPTGVPSVQGSAEVNERNFKDIEDCDKADLDAKSGISTTTPADAGVGAAKGAAVGLGVGAIAALASLMIPGIGLVVGGGALAIALAGAAGATGAGAVAGAVTGYLKDQGVEEHIATEFANTVQSGGTMFAVQVPSGKVDEAQARSILDKYGAENVHSYVSTGRGYVA